MKYVGAKTLQALITELKSYFVKKEPGKGVSSNDYTNAEKNKLAGIASGANKYVHPADHAASVITQDAEHRFVSDTEKNTWNRKANANHTHPVDSDLDVASDNPLANKTVCEYIIMLLEALDTKANANHTHPVDSDLNETSANPVQNKVLKQVFDNIGEVLVDFDNSKANAEHGHTIEEIYNLKEILNSKDGTEKYGVRFGGESNTGATVTRLYNAKGLVAGVGTDEQTAINDFDNIYPWSARRRCCGYWDDNGKFVVNAYRGEPGYIEDGTNGEVWVEHSLFFYKHEYSEDGAEEIVISATQLAGFLPAPIFLSPNGTVYQKAYTAAFPLATVDGKATSRAGVFSDFCSLNTGMEKARTLGENYTVGTTAEWYTECLYMWVEFATRNPQSVMVGASHMPYVVTDTATVAEDAANRIVVASAVAAEFVVGQTILIGTSLGSSSIANNRIVTAIEEYDAENKAIVFDGDPVNIAVGHIVCAAAWINGSCNGVISSSGSPVSNTNSKYNCVYRGKETPYGNAYEWISDILFNRQGKGTEESPYTYDVHFLSNPAQYSAGAITDDYIKLNFTVPGTDGYVKKLGYDSRFPWLRIPCKLGASTTTYYSDYYNYPRSAVCAARVGGAWAANSNNGPCYWYCNDKPSSSYVYSRARLSYHRD